MQVAQSDENSPFYYYYQLELTYYTESWTHSYHYYQKEHFEMLNETQNIRVSNYLTL